MGVEALLRLVEQQHPGRAHEGEGEVEELLLARGQLVREAVLEVADLERREHLLGPLLGALAPAPGRVDEDEVVDEGEVAVRRRGAEQRRDRRPADGVALVDGAPLEGDRAGARGGRPGQQPQQRGLARAVLPAQDGAAAGGDGHRRRPDQVGALDGLAAPLATSRASGAAFGRAAALARERGMARSLPRPGGSALRTPRDGRRRSTPPPPRGSRPSSRPGRRSRRRTSPGRR